MTKQTAICILFILFVIAYFGCKTTPKPIKYCSLVITLDSTIDFVFPFDATLSGKNFVSAHRYGYDSCAHTFRYHWDSLESGNYLFNVDWLFYTSQQDYPFTLSGDTSFFIRSGANFTTIQALDSVELSNADTVEMTYTSEGCFHNYLERTLLVKSRSGNNYLLHSQLVGIGSYDRDTQEIVPLTIIGDLIRMQRFHPKADTVKFGKETIIFFTSISTAQQHLYLLFNNKLFDFVDNDSLYSFRDRYIGFEKYEEIKPDTMTYYNKDLRYDSTARKS